MLNLFNFEHLNKHKDLQNTIISIWVCGVIAFNNWFYLTHKFTLNPFLLIFGFGLSYYVICFLANHYLGKKTLSPKQLKRLNRVACIALAIELGLLIWFFIIR